MTDVEEVKIGLRQVIPRVMELLVFGIKRNTPVCTFV